MRGLVTEREYVFLSHRCREVTDKVAREYPQITFIDKGYRRVEPDVGPYLTCRAVSALRPCIDWPVH